MLPVIVVSLSPLVKNTEGLILTILYLEMLLLSVPVLIFNIIFLLLILTTLSQYEIGCSGAVQDFPVLFGSLFGEQEGKNEKPSAGSSLSIAALRVLPSCSLSIQVSICKAAATDWHTDKGVPGVESSHPKIETS